MSNLRPCYVIRGDIDTRKALFHGWYVEAHLQHGLVVGSVSGQVSSVYAIVEHEDGQIRREPPGYIRFADAMHKEYAWLPIDEEVSE